MEGKTNMCKIVNDPGLGFKATFVARVSIGDSDDSDTEGGLGNVERVVMRPPGHSGKAKRGHLCFDSSFETGNLGRVDFITENEYDLFARPDTCNPRIRFWFHFSVENVQKGQRIIFNIVNLSKQKNLFQKGMAPVVRSTSRSKWQRLPSSQVYYYRSPAHSNAYVLSFAFAFDVEEMYFFALSFPYSYSRCQEALNSLQLLRPNLVKVDTITETVQGRSVYQVSILNDHDTQNGVVGAQEDFACSSDDDDDYDTDFLDPLPERPMIVILARSHPGDSNTSFLAQGMIEFLSSHHTIAKELREKVDFVIFPMMNPDGVFLGNSRCNLLGVDLNRSWNKLSLGIPELHHVREFILKTSKERRLEFVLDLHGNTSLSGIFVQGNAFDSVYRFERHIVFPKLLSQNCPDFDQENTMYNVDPDKEGTCRRFISTNTSESGTNTFSIEVSWHGYRNEDATITPYSVEDFMMHGRRITRSLWEYFKVTGIIKSKLYKTPGTSKPTSEPTTNVSAPTADEVKGNAAFTMIRLRNIAHQKDIFSSLESFHDEQSGSISRSRSVSRSRSRSRTPTNRVSIATLKKAFNTIDDSSTDDDHHHQPVSSSSTSDDDEDKAKLIHYKRKLLAKKRDSSKSMMKVVGKSIDQGSPRLQRSSRVEESIVPHDLHLGPKVQKEEPRGRSRRFSSILKVRGISPIALDGESGSPRSESPMESPLLIRKKKPVGGGGGQITPQSQRKFESVKEEAKNQDDDALPSLQVVQYHMSKSKSQSSLQ